MIHYLTPDISTDIEIPLFIKDDFGALNKAECTESFGVGFHFTSV